MDQTKFFTSLRVAFGGLLVILYFGLTGCSGTSAADTGHEGHDEAESGEHGHHHEELLQVSEDRLESWGVRLARAGSGVIATEIELPGEVRLNPDRLAHVGPAVPGVATRVLKTVGQPVRAGETLAVLRSRELSECRSARLIAAKRLELAEKTYNREETLWKESISSERDYLEAQRDLEEARIAVLDATQKLEALGFGQGGPGAGTETLNEYRLVSPLDGVVIEKHLTLGETVGSGDVAFTVADLGDVWVEFSIYQKDLPLVNEGMRVEITSGAGLVEGEGVISWVGPLLGEDTRTGMARVVLENRDGRWKPGLFVSGRIAAGEQELPVVIETGALLGVEDRASVFVRTERGFEPRLVKTGRRGGSRVEILEGLVAGEEYAAEGAFMLQSELEKDSFAGEGDIH